MTQLAVNAAAVPAAPAQAQAAPELAPLATASQRAQFTARLLEALAELSPRGASDGALTPEELLALAPEDAELEPATIEPEGDPTDESLGLLESLALTGALQVETAPVQPTATPSLTVQSGDSAVQPATLPEVGAENVAQSAPAARFEPLRFPELGGAAERTGSAEAGSPTLEAEGSDRALERAPEPSPATSQTREAPLDPVLAFGANGRQSATDTDSRGSRERGGTNDRRVLEVVTREVAPDASLQRTDPAAAQVAESRATTTLTPVPRALPELPARNETEIIDQTRLLLSRRGGQAQIELQPPQLGNVGLSIRVTDHHVSLQISADRQQVAELIARHLPELQHSLAAQGLHIDSATVDLRERTQDQELARDLRDGARRERDTSEDPDTSRRNFERPRLPSYSLGAVDVHA